VFRDENILPLIWVVRDERGTGRVGVECMGESVDGVEEVDGEPLYRECLGSEDIPSRLSLEVTEFGDGAKVLVLKSQLERDRSVLLVRRVHDL